MLGKVMRHEFKSTGKLLIPLNIVMIGITVIGMIVLGLNIFSNERMALIAVALMLVYILGMLAVALGSFIYLAVRFYKSMFGAEGYLTHTLPVSKLTVICAKLLVALCWYIICAIIIICSIFSLVYTGFRGVGVNVDMALIFHQIELVAGVSIPVLMVWLLLLIIVSSLSGLLMIYASLSIGQLFNKYKVAAAVVTYIIFYLINQVISTLITMKTSMDGLDETIVMSTNGMGETTFNMASFYGPLAFSSVIQAVIYSVVFFLITYYICNKKLNLD